MKNNKAIAFILMLSFIFVFCTMTVGFAESANSDNASDKSSIGEKRRLIIDSDTGGDDALAIMMAAKSPNIIIEGVTVLQGNVTLEQAAKNALMTLEIAGCDSDVYLGATTAIDGVARKTFSVYGIDGMGDHDMIHPTRKPSDKGAVDFILETVKKYPDEIEIAAIGPVTNIANAILKDPETMSHVKRIWSMGTAGLGQGNATPVSEFNVYKDAEAYKIMLDSGIDITIVGLDLCERIDAFFTARQLKIMKQGNETLQYISLAFDKLLEFRMTTRGVSNVDICDAIAMSCLIWPDYVVETINCKATCITHECEARGEVIFYRTDRVYDSMPEIGEANIRLVTDINLDHYFEKVIALLLTGSLE